MIFEFLTLNCIGMAEQHFTRKNQNHLCHIHISPNGDIHLFENNNQHYFNNYQNDHYFHSSIL